MVRVTAPHSVGARVLVPLIAAFREEYPGITFDVVLTDLFTDLVAGEDRHRLPRRHQPRPGPRRPQAV